MVGFQSNSRTIHSTAVENTDVHTKSTPCLKELTKKNNIQKNCLGNSCIVRMRRNRDCLCHECKETEGHENKEKESRK